MMEKEKEVPSFFSPSYDAVTDTTMTNVTPANDGEHRQRTAPRRRE